MQIKKDSHEYACLYLKPGYFETGVLKEYLRGSSNFDGTPSYFWTDNIDTDEVGNYRVRLKRVYDANIEEDVYIPREYVLLITTQKVKGHEKPDTRKIGFVMPESANDASAA
jgi:hypothetical protein